ncbi:hypothetical protein [Cohnella hongkongensis]|uniref:Uncharacterized protein n=1 Tax=Cohnella hongkongensis TaxID=178337 RepID=A0ABV9FD76_9BACL
MDLDLQVSLGYVRSKLQERGRAHLSVRAQGRSLVIYSRERGEEAIRAVLTRLEGRPDYALSIANHRGKWQLVSVVGPLREMMDMLTGELAFALAYWPDNGPHRDVR